VEPDGVPGVAGIAVRVGTLIDWLLPNGGPGGQPDADGGALSDRGSILLGSRDQRVQIDLQEAG
jgi:hypothetical protein